MMIHPKDLMYFLFYFLLSSAVTRGSLGRDIKEKITSCLGDGGERRGWKDKVLSVFGFLFFATLSLLSVLLSLSFFVLLHASRF